MDWPSVAVGAGAALVMVGLGASPLARFALAHRTALVSEIEKERTRRVTAERAIADLLASIDTMHASLEKVARELAVAVRDLMMARAENQRLRQEADLRSSGGTAT